MTLGGELVLAAKNAGFGLISAFGRMDFHLEVQEIGLRGGAGAPKMTAKPMAEKGSP
jgi:hypothetical protein